jgi:glucose/arabinose dehydrogenase
MRRALLFLAPLALMGCGQKGSAPGVEAPDGVRVATVAKGAGRPSNIAVDRHGVIWTTSAGYESRPTDGVWRTARAGAQPRQVVRVDYALGLAWYRDELYVSHRVRINGRRAGRITAFSRYRGGRFHRRRVVIPRIPVGTHDVDSIAAGPDGRLYAGVGSRTNSTRGPSRLSATIVSFRPHGGGLRVEARGLRNPYGLAFLPGSRDLLVSDNGRDDLGPSTPPDELNLVHTARRRAASYGFPGCWGQGGRACRGTTRALVRLAAHAAAAGVAVARRFGRYGLSAYIAENGASPPYAGGNDVVRVSLRRRHGRWVGTAHRFAHGFAAHDPTSVAVGPDGALYVALNASGSVLRLTARPSVHRGSTKG